MCFPRTSRRTSATDAVVDSILAALAFAVTVAVTIGLVVIAFADDATTGVSSEHGASFCPQCHEEGPDESP